MQEQRHEEEMASQGETSGSNCLQPHFHAVKLQFFIDEPEIE